MADPNFAEETVFPDADGEEMFSVLLDGADVPPEAGKTSGSVGRRKSLFAKWRF